MKKFLTFAALFAVVAAGSRAADVAENWDNHCASCHGKDGKGETKAGRKAKVKDLTDAAYQKEFSDEQGFKSTKEGITDDKGKEKMKAFAEKLSDDEIKALVTFIRTLAK